MSKIIFSRLALFAGAFAGLTLFAAAAQAQAAPALPQVAVPYADLNLGTVKGRTVLVARIERAASVVCGSAPDLRNIPASRRFAECVRESTQSAAASVQEPAVRTALETMLTAKAGT